MADYLLTKDWKAVLAEKTNKSVKKTGVSETLDDYAAAKKKDDIGKMVSALERVVEKAETVKTTYKSKPEHKTIVDFLTKTVTAAKTEQQKLAVRLKQKDGTDEDNEDSTLGKALVKVRQLTEDSAWHFVVAPGKPSSGMVISKKPIKKENIDKAFEMKGKRGPFFIGRCFFDAGKYILQLEDKPPAGLAKAAKNAALLHGEMRIKIAVRGAGVELDDETDLEPQEEGSGPTGPAHLRDEERYSTYKSRVGQISTAVGKFETSANVREDGADSGLRGAIKILTEQIDSDTALTQNMKDEFLSDLQASLLRISQANSPAVNPAAKYPDLMYWSRMAESIVRLDPAKRDDAWDKFNARLAEVKDQFDKDTALVNPARATVADTLRAAAGLLRQQEDNTVDLFERSQETGNAKLGRRIAAMERRYDAVLGAEGLDERQVTTLTRAFQSMRQAFREDRLDENDPRITQIEVLLEKLAQLAFAHRAETSRVRGQQDLHETMKPAIEFFKKAAIPSGLIKDPGFIRQQAESLPDIRNLISAMGEATKQPGAKSGKAMEDAARALQRAPDVHPDVLVLAQQVLARGTMMQMAEEYANLGNPPWSTANSDRATELQAQMFFVESVITNKLPEYNMPRLTGSDSGASGSWWIERAEPNRGGKPGAKRKLIFKPALEEATVIPGLLPGSGAMREVMAKRLDENMVGAGFDIGVSPTSLAVLDGSMLDLKKGANRIDSNGPVTGSMQQLAPSNGSFGDKMEDLSEFSKTIDKRSFDDVAVFDMIYANLDRHAKNMLFATDPDTGKSRLVPIDHGSSLPEPDALQSNAAALLPGFNIMADDNMAPAQEPLGEETVEALLRLDPDQLVRSMKQSRDEMAQRHPDTQGMMTDAAIDAMGARVNFIRAAASQNVPVARIFEMLAIGAVKISRAAANDMADLVTELLETVTRNVEGRAELNQIWDGFRDDKGVLDIYQVTDVLKNLGWGWSLAKGNFTNWVNENPKLVSRILRTQQQNPAIIAETDRLLVQARTIVADIDRKIEKKDLVGRYEEAFKVVFGEATKAQPRNTKLDVLVQMFEDAGGMAELTKAALVFPGDMADKLTDPPGAEPDDLRFLYSDRVMYLAQWKAFQDVGGLDEILRLGGTIPRETRVGDAIRQLNELKVSGDAISELLDLDEDEVDGKTAAKYQSGLIDVADALKTLRNPDTLKELTQRRDEAAVLWRDGKVGAALGKVSRAQLLAATRTQDEMTLIADITGRLNQVRNEFGTLDPQIQQSMAPHMAGVYALYQEGIDTAANYKRVYGDNQYATRKEIAQKGNDSAFAKAQRLLDQLKNRSTAHAQSPWSKALADRVVEIEKSLANFDMVATDTNNRLLLQCLDGSDLMLAALADADLNALPQAAQTEVDTWINNLQSNSRLDQAAAYADRLRKALAG